MIYLRKFLDMFFLSIIPSLISFLIMNYRMSYSVWFTCCIISTLIFFIGNAFLIRRFARDIRSKSKYYFVWLITFAVYAGLGGFLYIFKYMYPFTWIYFHTRIFEIVTMSLETPIRTWVSFVISISLYLILILVSYPLFRSAYAKKKERNKINASNLNNVNHAASSTKSQSPKTRHYSDTTMYSERQLKKMDRMKNMRPKTSKKRIHKNKSASEKLYKRIWKFLFEIGSYEFYQTLEDKVNAGNLPGPIIKSYLKRKLHLGTYSKKYK